MRKADVNRFDDTVVQATIAVEDISVPLWNTQIANRPQSHIQREKARGREALEFCRRAILNASGLLVVAPRYEDTDRLVHCRLELLDEQGDKVDLGALLVKNGFGSRDVLDWGRRSALIAVSRQKDQQVRKQCRQKDQIKVSRQRVRIASGSISGQEFPEATE